MVPQMIGEGIRVQFINDRPVVSARDLHEALEIGTAFRKWFPRMCEYGFREGADYGKVYQKWDSSSTGQNIVDYRISVDMAKHLCMLQRNEKGKMYRQYFLELERAWNSPEKVMARALQIAQAQLEDLRARCRALTQRTQDQEEKIREIQPKADYLDNVLECSKVQQPFGGPRHPVQSPRPVGSVRAIPGQRLCCEYYVRDQAL